MVSLISWNSWLTPGTTSFSVMTFAALFIGTLLGCFLGARGFGTLLGPLLTIARFPLVAGTVTADFSDSSLVVCIAETASETEVFNLLESGSDEDGCNEAASSVSSCTSRAGPVFVFFGAVGLEKGNSRFGGSM